MKDQHTLIKGYRDLSQQEIDLMNKIKSSAEKFGEWFSDPSNENNWEGYVNLRESSTFKNLLCELSNNNEVDHEWISVAEDLLDNNSGVPGSPYDRKTDIQLAFMALVRSVSKPTSF